jgi:hypothetical protein
MAGAGRTCFAVQLMLLWLTVAANPDNVSAPGVNV